MTDTTMYMMIAAIAAVHRNVIMVVPITLPALEMDFMLAIAEAMEANTIGTTTQNMELMNRVPNGSRTVAPGHTRPVMVPATIDTIIQMTKR